MRRHQHAEAFLIMAYVSEDGRMQELIWNSRDGVTPFMVRSRDGKTMLQHVRMADEVYDPHHVPKPGDRVFVTLTKERARDIAEHRVKDAPQLVEPWLDGRTLEEFTAELAESIWHNGWEPDIVTVGPEGWKP